MSRKDQKDQNFDQRFLKFGNREDKFPRKFLPLTLQVQMSGIYDMTPWSLRTAVTPDTVKIMKIFCQIFLFLTA